MKIAPLETFIRKITSVVGDAFPTFERLVLLFPIALTVSIATTLLCGGRIVATHWWCILLLSVGITLFQGRHQWRKTLLSVGGVLFLLCLMWVGNGLFVQEIMTDYGCYHFPATQLLLEGWNPIYEGTAEAIESTLTIDPFGMWLWHVLSLPKAVWYFSASAFTFFQSPFNFFAPLSMLLFIPVAASLWRYNKRLGGGSIGLLVILPPSFLIGVDCVIALSAIGLLLTMGLYLKGRGSGYALPLLCYSFWMMNSKQSALLACFIFWCCFSLLMVWRTWPKWRIRLMQGIAIVGILVVTFIITSFSPYFTQWLNYGHPLYPCYTTDEAQHPVYNIVGDFSEQNPDAQAMGHMGFFCNAYISSSLTQAYYRWKLNQDTFHPRAKTWEQTWRQNQRPFVDSPLTPWTRTLYGIVTLLICLFGKKTSRILMLMVWLSCFLVPTPMIGYPRYTPWTALLFLLAFESIGNIRHTLFRRMGYGLMLGVILCGHYAKVRDYLIAIDQAYMLQANIIQHPPQELIYTHPEEKVRKDERVWKMGPYTRKTYFELLNRKVPALSNTSFIPVEEDAEVATLGYIPPLEAYIQKNDDHFVDSLFMNNNLLPSMKERFLNCPKIALEIIGIRMPHLLYDRLQTLFGGNKPPLTKDTSATTE